MPTLAYNAWRVLIALLILQWHCILATLDVDGRLGSVLSRHVLLHSSDLTHGRARDHPRWRNARDLHTKSGEIQFTALERRFKLLVHHDPSLFSTDFSAVVMQGIPATSSYKVPIQVKHYLVGELADEQGSSSISAHLSPDGVLTAQIITSTDTFYVEPAHYFLNTSYDSHMIVYKSSDIRNKRDIKHKLDTEIPLPVMHPAQKSHDIRQSPSLATRTRCPMVVVADYNFFSLLESSETSVIHRLISIVAQVNAKTFLNTSWITDGEGTLVSGLGLQIGMVVVHKDPSDSPTHYNSATDFTSGELLTRFSEADWSRWCLAHLVTDRSFPSGRLGLAYIASPSGRNNGGICSGRIIMASTGKPMNYNTGLSVGSTGDLPLPLGESVIIMGHGHNWGSHHDSLSCGGPYLMNEFVQDGSMETHTQFSRCSRAGIGRVLVNKAHCFVASTPHVCGDYIIEGEEECDGGLTTRDGNDPCCDRSCKLRPTATCSDKNHDCCSNCTTAPRGSILCHNGNQSLDCTTNTFCSGLNSSCPVPSAAPTGTTCLSSSGFRGSCVNDGGEVSCHSLCQLANLTDCRCMGAASCMTCCNNTVNGSCDPLVQENNVFPLYNGHPCPLGFCTEGECVSKSQDFISRLWAVITTLDVDQISQLIRENIVGFILILSLLVWVPGSCLFHCLCDRMQLWKKFITSNKAISDGDSERDEEEEEEEEEENLKFEYDIENLSIHSWKEYTPLVSDQSEQFQAHNHPLHYIVEEPVDDSPLPPSFRVT